MIMMMNYMRDGGFGMWLMLLTAVAFAVLAFVRGPAGRAEILSVGCILVLIEGVLGLSTGMVAVSQGYWRFPGEPAAVIAQGLGELANNGTFAATLSTLLLAGALLSRRAATSAASQPTR